MPRATFVTAVVFGLASLAVAVLESPGAPGAADPLGGGRYGSFSQKAAQGPHLKVLSATHFGGPGHESFDAVGQLADGTVVAFGNAWGPELPSKLPVVTLGQGKHSGQARTLAGKDGSVVPDPKSPDMAGLIVFYTVSDTALKATRYIRFDWAVANITTAIVAGDGKGLIVSGRCLGQFGSLSARAKTTTTVPYKAPAPPAAPVEAKKKKKAPAPVDPATLADVYVARLSPQGEVEWVVVLEKNNDPPDAIYTDLMGRVYFDARGLIRIAPDGKDVSVINTRSAAGPTRWLGVDPASGQAFFGGDRNTHTGHQPWRQPFLYRYDHQGNKTLTLWEFNPKECACGTGGNGLCSDSSPRAMAFDKNGDWLFAGWSDGGNTVFARQATDWRQNASSQGMGMNAAGANASSLAHMMRIDPKTSETKAYTFWSAYVPMFFGEERSRGKPNGASIQLLAVLESGAVAIAGGAATGLVQTPNAFWKDPLLPDKHGGAYVSVFRPDLTNLMFSSYTPGIDNLAIAPIKSGLAIVGTSRGSDRWVKPTPAPSINPDHPYTANTDAWLCILREPKK